MPISIMKSSNIFKIVLFLDFILFKDFKIVWHFYERLKMVEVFKNYCPQFSIGVQWLSIKKVVWPICYMI